MIASSSTSPPSRFPIPLSLPDLEREPYNLLPYPVDFDDANDHARAESFAQLVRSLDQGNRVIFCNNNSSPDRLTNLFPLDTEDDDPWMDEARMQALYTLVRKSTSLAPETRLALANALSTAVRSLCTLLQSYTKSSENGVATTVSQAFRDAYACHVYMLYSFMFFLESEAQGKTVDESILQLRSICATAMVMAAETSAASRSVLWPRGVPDEAVVVLPCRIAYRMLEAATGVLARKAACGDAAVRMIAVTVDDALRSTVTAALMDLMHSFEHMASLTVEICQQISVLEGVDKPNRLAIELIREIGRLNVSSDAKSSVGVKFVAPFISELAESHPRLVMSHLSHLLPHLQSEPYSLRSSIVTAIAHILEYLGKQQESSIITEEERSDIGPLLHDTTKTRTSLLDVLIERTYDVSSYTRAAVLKAWIRLCQTQSIPKEQVVVVTRLAMDRLQDKTVVVRKQAMQLLTLLLEHNPYQGNLHPEPYRVKLAELYDFIQAHMPPHIAAAAEKELLDDAESREEVERAALAAAIAEADTMILTETLSDAEREYCTKVQALKFTQSALEFIDVFEDATKALEGMLLSVNNSDVTEALRFFVKARHFGLPCAVEGMKRALALMWSTEASVRDEVLQAFSDVFLLVPGGSNHEYLPHDEIARNLLVLVRQASVSEVASIEEAIIRLVTAERLPDDLFLILWSYASKGDPETRAAALQLIAMGAGADRTIVDSKSRLKLLLDAGLGAMYEDTANHWALGRSAALCLQRIERASIDPSDAKYLVLERIIEELCVVCRGDHCSDANTEDVLRWFSTAEHAIKALFVISPEPEIVCKNILVQMCHSTFPENTTMVHSLRLARFFHVFGQIAISLLVYTEAISGSVRRGNAKMSLMKQEAADKAQQRRGGEEDDAIEAELGVAAEAEAENERRLADIAEHEIVGRNLLSLFGPLLIRVVANEGGVFDSEILMQASTLALCKCMCVSSQFCEKHLPLLFTALANAPPEDTTMRANTVIALGDLAFRFPNEVEPYTPRMYACLRDASITVRRHTLMVLTHLILNDMVKVKGQVCEIAMCLRDNDPRIRDMSRLLFHELSKRSNNPIYNLLPEIISQLSQMSIAVEDFRAILTFLLGFIKKERQNEMLMEKLCQRFPKCTTMAQSADLAYCIGQLKLTEKSIKCLSDYFHLYKNALADDQVLKIFTNIVVKAKKFMKPERKQLMEEWEAKLNEFAAMGIENQRADEKAAQSSKRRLNNTKKRRVQKSVVLEEVEEDLDFPEEEDEKVESNDLVDSDEENLKPSVPKPSGRKARGKNGVKQGGEVDKESRNRPRRSKATS